MAHEKSPTYGGEGRRLRDKYYRRAALETLYALKYLALGWYVTMAVVDCSG